MMCEGEEAWHTVWGTSQGVRTEIAFQVFL